MDEVNKIKIPGYLGGAIHNLSLKYGEVLRRTSDRKPSEDFEKINLEGLLAEIKSKKVDKLDEAVDKKRFCAESGSLSP